MRFRSYRVSLLSFFRFVLLWFFSLSLDGVVYFTCSTKPCQFVAFDFRRINLVRIIVDSSTIISPVRCLLYQRVCRRSIRFDGLRMLRYARFVNEIVDCTIFCSPAKSIGFSLLWYTRRWTRRVRTFWTFIRVISSASVVDSWTRLFFPFFLSNEIVAFRNDPKSSSLSLKRPNENLGSPDDTNRYWKSFRDRSFRFGVRIARYRCSMAKENKKMEKKRKKKEQRKGQTAKHSVPVVVSCDSRD